MTGFDRMEDQLAYLIASVNRQLEEQLADVLRSDGLAIEQFRIISVLSSSDGRSMRDLASQAITVLLSNNTISCT
ncbi:MAG: hypothetical protein PGN25_14895 [Methylorubrum populi]